MKELERHLSELNRDLRKRIYSALHVALECSQVDGEHHKAWVIDQMVQCLTGDKYEEWIKEFKYGEDGPDTYSWDVGVAP